MKIWETKLHVVELDDGQCVLQSDPIQDDLLEKIRGKPLQSFVPK